MNAIFHLRVVSGALSGCAEDGIRIHIAPGIYRVHHENDTLEFVDADPRMRGTVSVDLREYGEIGAFPDELTRNGLTEIV
ncbi:hypothetical protein BURKHO8Y_70203 [Burkholderia sp. 8Y]|uniref:hypothetical protein n=1 Tax=Burkholderia sp. 8Y TaxID=2653133 RepID=UPI0012F45E45|nr:hypothetical protein [Burkholderia sp. 8Y]VXC97635.1 hypothetical protein BURKHO8Y_70203 [Burkholderia sp. 8Y]